MGERLGWESGQEEHRAGNQAAQAGRPYVSSMGSVGGHFSIYNREGRWEMVGSHFYAAA